MSKPVSYIVPNSIYTSLRAGKGSLDADRVEGRQVDQPRPRHGPCTWCVWCVRERV